MAAYALVLAVTFYEKVLGQADRITADPLLLPAWIAWLAAAVAGAFYQYLAVRFLEAKGMELGLLVRTGHRQGLWGLARRLRGRCTARCTGASRSGSLAFLLVGALRLLG